MDAKRLIRATSCRAQIQVTISRCNRHSRPCLTDVMFAVLRMLTALRVIGRGRAKSEWVFVSYKMFNLNNKKHGRLICRCCQQAASILPCSHVLSGDWAVGGRVLTVLYVTDGVLDKVHPTSPLTLEAGQLSLCVAVGHRRPHTKTCAHVHAVRRLSCVLCDAQSSLPWCHLVTVMVTISEAIPAVKSLKSVTETVRVFQLSRCERCRCEANREVYCSISDCPAPHCVNPTYEPNHCCPICKTGKAQSVLGFQSCAFSLPLQHSMTYPDPWHNISKTNFIVHGGKGYSVHHSQAIFFSHMEIKLLCIIAVLWCHENTEHAHSKKKGDKALWFDTHTL